MSKVISAAHTETQMDELLREPTMAKVFGRKDAVQKFMSFNVSDQVKQAMLYHLQTVHWYLNH